MIRRGTCESGKFVRHQKRVVALPSLNSPQRSEGDGRCWANLQNTHFSGLTRKNSFFKRSVLKYVSIKIRILTLSGQKSRVCVNPPDRLLHPIHACLFCPSGTRFRPPAKLGRLRGARFRRTARDVLLIVSALRALGFALRRSGDACAARGKVGPVMGLRPLRGPPCIPPEAPPKKVFNFLGATRATRLKLRELPSLAPLAQAISLRDA